MTYFFGQLAVGTFQGQRLHVRYGTSRLGPDWEIIEGDLFGYIPADDLTDVVLVLCEKCGTDHEGFPSDTIGGEMRCLRAQAAALGAGHLVDQIDAGKRDMDVRRDAWLRAEGIIP